MHRSEFGISRATIKIMETPEFDRILENLLLLLCSSKRYPYPYFRTRIHCNYTALNKIKRKTKNDLKSVCTSVCIILVQSVLRTNIPRHDVEL